jgi:hypothetical protein
VRLARRRIARARREPDMNSTGMPAANPHVRLMSGEGKRGHRPSADATVPCLGSKSSYRTGRLTNRSNVSHLFSYELGTIEAVAEA